MWITYDDFSHDDEVQEFVKQDLKIEMRKIEDTDYHSKVKENVVRVFITRIDREEREEE